ncbi:MAG: SDR family oxidoreductase [Acinetobacter sp.]|uniref:SDR family oxidoreductase n=1 Tax=Acinetobacter sp. TaxID=472 RepID=UPI0026E000F4|nr:SDR family oxidoreductase [Acinetobacter sp.]MDO5543406.1 SDR family oxidoreductase [Acinetobacter sp.]
MKNVLVLGATGQIAQWAIDFLQQQPEISLTLFLRDKNKLASLSTTNTRIIEGDVLNIDQLTDAMKGQDVVYANLAGDMEGQTQNIITVMKKINIQRLISINTLGIYDEVPGNFGKWNNQEIGEYFPAYRKSADLIESSDLDYTIIRAAWLTDENEVDFEITHKGDAFKGTVVSRKSVAYLVNQIIENPNLYSKKNLGVSKPNSDADKPYFM